MGGAREADGWGGVGWVGRCTPTMHRSLAPYLHLLKVGDAVLEARPDNKLFKLLDLDGARGPGGRAQAVSGAWEALGASSFGRTMSSRRASICDSTTAKRANDEPSVRARREGGGAGAHRQPRTTPAFHRVHAVTGRDRQPHP